MADFKIAVFDAYGTLFKVNSESQEITERCKGKSKELQALWRTRQLEYTWLRSLMNNWVDFDTVTENALDFALETFQLHDKVLRQLLLDIYKSPTRFDDVIPYLKRLKSQGIQTAILSNGTIHSLEKSVEKTGLSTHLDKVLSAEIVQMFKVSPKVYQLVLNAFTCDKDEVRFFSSNAWDIAGAGYFGFSTTWVNRQDVVFEKLGVEPNNITHALGE